MKNTLSTSLNLTKRRVRILQLLEALERTALAPVETDKFHSFAYLADVLSPVYSLLPFDKRIVKSGRSPYYPDLQGQLDMLVAMGLVVASELKYQRGTDGSMIFNARYALNFGSTHGQRIREALDEDRFASDTQYFLDELARALASLKDEDIAAAASEDATYQDPNISSGDIISFENYSRASSKTLRTTDALDQLFPGVELTPSRRIYMYAHYLGRRVDAS